MERFGYTKCHTSQWRNLPFWRTIRNSGETLWNSLCVYETKRRSDPCYLSTLWTLAIEAFCTCVPLRKQTSCFLSYHTANCGNRYVPTDCVLCSDKVGYIGHCICQHCQTSHSMWKTKLRIKVHTELRKIWGSHSGALTVEVAKKKAFLDCSMLQKTPRFFYR